MCILFFEKNPFVKERVTERKSVKIKIFLKFIHLCFTIERS